MFAKRSMLLTAFFNFFSANMFFQRAVSACIFACCSSLRPRVAVRMRASRRRWRSASFSVSMVRGWVTLGWRVKS
jgi:hypothetical protein